ncbi:MAG: hypothetical protein EOP45_10330 [Sphingobacteriaceae bacterium]|nr:MAG: hypothetical protein EOP45_10330 [Sphingobacteriaceae bacterium]
MNDEVLSHTSGMTFEQLNAFTKERRIESRKMKDALTSVPVDNPEAQAHYQRLVEKERAESDIPPDERVDDTDAPKNWTPHLQREKQSFPMKKTLIILDEENYRLTVQNYHNAYGFDDQCVPVGEPVDLSGLKKKTYITFHSNSFRMYYKPSVDEMISQLPQDTYEKYQNGEKMYLKNRIISDDVGLSTCPNYSARYHIAITEAFY